MFTLRSYQQDIAFKAFTILKNSGLVYITAEVRTGKTLMALETAELFGAKKVLFLTKKKAISSIKSDYLNFGYKYDIVVTNDESMHKITDTDFDLVIHDEHHRFGAIPKPGKYTRMFKQMFGHLPMIFLSGTPAPETPMQWFHQFWVSNKNPFEVNNFYIWHKKWGFLRKEFDLGYGLVNNYSNTEETVYKYWSVKMRSLSKNDPEYEDKLNYIIRSRSQDVKKVKELNSRLQDFVMNYCVTFTQSQAGFETKVDEEVLNVTMKPIIYELSNRLKKDLVIQGKDEVILADTSVKLMGKLLQLSSGTIIFESGNSQVLDTSKIDFISNKFNGKRIGIFYKFKAEWEMIKNKFGDDVTEDINEFDRGVKHIALQYLSGREGISLKNADVLVFLTPDFSATTYLQARDRLSTMSRLENKMYWILSDSGIDRKVQETVVKKKTYTTRIFERDFKNV